MSAFQFIKLISQRQPNNKIMRRVQFKQGQNMVVQSSRQFSMYSKIQGKSILMSDQFPPQIRIPVNENKTYDVTLFPQMNIDQFLEQLQISTQCSSITIPRHITYRKMSDIMRDKFFITINKQDFEVFPSLATMVEQPKSKSREIAEEILRQYQVPQSRRLVLEHYLSSLIDKLESTQNLEEKDILNQVESALKQYSQDYSRLILKHPKQVLEKTKIEYDKMKQLEQEIHIQADNYSQKMLWLGFSATMLQLAGLGSLIFVFSSWEVIEPITYLISNFYAVIGAGFYLRYRHDFDFSNGLQAFKAKKLRKLMIKNSFDQGKIKFLKEYIELLEKQISILEN